MATATKKAATRKQAITPAPIKKKAAATATNSKKDNDSSEKTPFEKLFENLLKDIYWAEQQLVEALKKMYDAATTEELKNAFEDHLFVTQKHVSRLEKVFSLTGVEAEGKKCDAMAGLIKESEQVIKETEEGSMTRDAGLIIAAQKVEHYEIASYGSLVQVALTLGHDQVARILEKTLSEEEDTDILLTEIAETEVNPMADSEEEEEEDDDMEESAASSEEQ